MGTAGCLRGGCRRYRRLGAALGGRGGEEEEDGESFEEARSCEKSLPVPLTP